MTDARLPNSEDEQLAELARLYYEEGLTQSQIGRQLGVSHSTVSRLLRDVRARGIVEIRINYPLPRSREMEETLVARYALRGARVLVSDGLSYPEVLRRTGMLAARALSALLTNRTVLGISWGTGVAATVDAMPQHDLPSATVVQMIGGIGSTTPAIDGIELARRLGEKLGCRHHYLPAPLMVPAAQVHEGLIREPGIAAVLELARRADLALVGIGAVEPDQSSLVRGGFLSPQQAEEITRLGAAGDICGQAYYLDGRPCPPPLGRRVVGISLDDLRRIPCIIGVAGGQAKARAVVGALSGRYVNYLITDSRAAEVALRT
jgi:DNA-binding transcriptional regulator LsrR (DeoR family)